MFLAKAGVASLVIDKATFPRDKICGDAMSGKVVEVLDELDASIIPRLMLEQQLGSHGVTFVAPNLSALRVPFRSATDHRPPTTVNGHQATRHRRGSPEAAGNGQPAIVEARQGQQTTVNSTPPGFLCRRMVFDNFLVNEMSRYPLITFQQGVEANSFERIDGRWIVSNKNKETICSAKLLLIADGAQSRFSRHIAGLAMLPRHHTAAIRGYYHGVQGLDAENFVEMHFLKEFIPGYFWIFPLPNGWANVGAGMRSDTVSKKHVNLRQQMTKIIETTPQLRERFAGATLEGSIQGYGLPMGSKKRKISGDGYLLLGDAMWLVDPFTGEGIGNAMVSAKYASDLAVRSLDADDVSASFLHQYNSAIYNLLWSELKLSRRLQSLLHYPWLFNMIVSKASRNAAVRESISLMYEDVDLRKKLKRPGFYLKLMLS